MQIMPSAAPRCGFLAATFLLFTTSSPSAQTFGQVGERAQGMGGAFVAVADDASALYWNPAGLANVYEFDAQLSANSIHTNLLGMALPALGLGYYRVRTAVSSVESRKNGGSGEVRVSALATGNVGVSLLQTLVNTVVIGTTLRAVNGSDRTTFDLDAGAIASAGEIRVGVAARNVRRGLDAVRQVRAGVALAPRSLSTGVYGPFSVAFDADLVRTPTPAGDERQAAIGSEQWWAQGGVGTRLGVHWSTLGARKPAVAGGLTVKLRQSLFFDGHVTKGKNARDSGWGIGARLTF